MTAELSVLIVNYNTWYECAGAIGSLRLHPPTRPDGSPMPYQCIVVDNCSPDQDPQAIAAVEEQLEDLRRDQGDAAAGQLIRHPENSGYSRGVNLAYAQSSGRWILVSNPDLVFTPGMVSELQRHLERDPRAGCTVPRGFWGADFAGMLPPNTLPTLGDLLCTTLGQFSRVVCRWYARRLLRNCIRVWDAPKPLPLPMMSGCMFLMERSFFEAIGRMDERFPLYYEDADLSVRIRKAGRRVVQVPAARLVHYVNRSGATDMKTAWQRHHVSRRLYYRKWYGLLGSWLLSACEWAMRSPGLRWLRKTPPYGPVVDLGTSMERPRFELPRHCERFLVQLSLDPRFYLSGGVFGSGTVWEPSDATFANFSSTTYYCRVTDLSLGRCQELGIWRYTCVLRAASPQAAVAEG